MTRFLKVNEQCCFRKGNNNLFHVTKVRTPNTSLCGINVFGNSAVNVQEDIICPSCSAKAKEDGLYSPATKAPFGLSTTASAVA